MGDPLPGMPPCLDIHEAGQWLRNTGFTIEWYPEVQPPSRLWDAFIDAVQAEPEGWHDGTLDREECEDWLLDETGYDFTKEV